MPSSWLGKGRLGWSCWNRFRGWGGGWGRLGGGGGVGREGAGAAALAALLQKKTSLNGAHTAVMVCGGNIDVTLLSRIIERGLVQDGRMIRLRIHLLDKPGALAELTLLIAKYRANIVDTLYNRAYYGVNLGDTTIDITMETRGREQVEELLAALTAEGYKHD